MSLATNCVQIVTDPEGFFRENETFPSWQPWLIVILSSLTLGVQGILTGREVVTRAGGDFGAVNVAIPVVMYLLINLVTWGICAGFLHGLSALLGAEEGSFKQTALLTGWGFLPGVLSAIITAFASWFALQNIPETASAMEVQHQLGSHPTMKIATAIGIVITLWQGLIWVYAVYHHRNISLRNAAITAAVPTVIFAAIALYQLL